MDLEYKNMEKQSLNVCISDTNIQEYIAMYCLAIVIKFKGLQFSS